MTCNCKGICIRYKENTLLTKEKYQNGQKRCSCCGVYISYGGLRCPCCNTKLRLKSKTNSKRRAQDVEQLKTALKSSSIF